eukprot:2396090-Alexandrium_andersonii.AAC.1
MEQTEEGSGSRHAWQVGPRVARACLVGWSVGPRMRSRFEFAALHAFLFWRLPFSALRFVW